MIISTFIRLQYPCQVWSNRLISVSHLYIYRLPGRVYVGKLPIQGHLGPGSNLFRPRIATLTAEIPPNLRKLLIKYNEIKSSNEISQSRYITPLPLSSLPPELLYNPCGHKDHLQYDPKHFIITPTENI